MTRKKQLRYSCPLHELEALDYYSEIHGLTRAVMVELLLRRWLILNPGSLVVVSFPANQCLRAWLEYNQRTASGELIAGFDPENRQTFAGKEVAAGSQAVETIRLKIDAELSAALRWQSRSCWLGGSPGMVRHIVRTHLITEPLGFEMPQFPRWQHLELWVRANIECAKFGGPPVDSWERFGLTHPNGHVIRFNHLDCA
jgi:hypothetical protein